MEFAKYYDVTDTMNKMIEQGKLLLYICSDTHDFWIDRVLEGLNSEFEQEDGKWLVERNKIDKYDFIDYLKEQTGKTLERLGITPDMTEEEAREQARKYLAAQ